MRKRSMWLEKSLASPTSYVSKTIVPNVSHLSRASQLECSVAATLLLKRSLRKPSPLNSNQTVYNHC